MKHATVLERFLSKIKIAENGCWEWLGAHNDKGYGHFDVGSRNSRKTMITHIYSYETFVGPIPEGKELDHTCRNRGCVNPDHLEPVTHIENCRRGDAGIKDRSKTHCPQGHPYDEENTYIDYRGYRVCRICMRDSQKRYYDKLKVSACLT